MEPIRFYEIGAPVGVRILFREEHGPNIPFAEAMSLLLSLSKEAGEKRKRAGVSARRPGGTPPGERPM
jgi:hypothetical protein